MKNFLILPLLILGFSCSQSNTQTPNEDWEQLFNGKDLDGWIVKIHGHEIGDNYEETFSVNDGAILVKYDGYETFDERYGHLYYHKPFSSFHLKFTYRFTDKWMQDAPSYTYRNSGVMFHSQDPHTILKEQDWPISVEYQILAEEEAGKERPTANVCTPGTEVFYNDEMDPRHCINSTSKTYPWDQWLTGELIVFRDSLVIHLIEGDTVLRYTKPQIGGGVANRFDANYKQDGQMLKSGFIALQAEGQGIAFKEIWIREIQNQE
jgi:hypothetical protein